MAENETPYNRCMALSREVRIIMMNSRKAAHSIHKQATEDNPYCEVLIFKGFERPPLLLTIDFTRSNASRKFKAGIYDFKSNNLDDPKERVAVIEGEFTKRKDFIGTFSKWFDKNFKPPQQNFKPA